MPLLCGQCLYHIGVFLIIFVLAGVIANVFSGRSYCHLFVACVIPLVFYFDISLNCIDGRCYCHFVWKMETTLLCLEIMADVIAMVADGMAT